MTRTRSTTLVIVGLIGIVAGLLTDSALVASGRAVFVLPVTLSVTLAVIAVIVVVLAWPVRRAVKGTGLRHIDPFRAARTVVLAKACSIVGALLTGLPIGLLLFMLTRTVLGNTGGLVLTVAAIVGGALLLVGGLVAEWFCTLPPPENPDAEHNDPEPPSTSHSHA